MKKIDGYSCRSFGNEKTHLAWSDIPQKVSAMMAGSDGYDIWERVEETEDEDGNITETIYLYAIWNLHERHNSWDRPDWMSADDLIAQLSEEADEIAGEAAAEYFWDLDGWGSDYPPENADEIIQKANDKIVEWAVNHYWERGADVGEYASQLWEHYCSTGRID